MLRSLVGSEMCIRDSTENVCFVCSKDKWEFFRTGLSFQEHKATYHNLWDYVFWLLYLRTRGPKDMVGLESYVNRLVQNNDLSWIPNSRALSLEETRKNKYESLSGLLRLKTEDIASQ
eukprot:TRINITY_DN9342_c0_g1_i4.p1 TRINITY_DN9342_c0_g1~~TRINITY_DN9342_c0_g1_i4.p1  ORF type:complete len:118 (+),score=21.96 TRINITY_DN9342_c0_g1_i4:72-425(+)